MGTADKILPPYNKLIPISGQWEITSYKRGSSRTITDEEASKLIGKKAIFNEEAAVFNEESCTSPSYKIKNVNAADYMLYQYKISPEYLNITKNTIQVVTITSKNQFFSEFIRVDDSKIIASEDGVFFYLKKISNDTDEAYKAYLEENEMTQSIANSDGISKQSGILLGLRYMDADSKSMGGWKYRTVYISSASMQKGAVYETQNLFVPRKSGFWILGVNRETIAGKTQDKLFSYPVNVQMYRPGYNAIASGDLDTNIFNTILYAGNDYISTEYVRESQAGKTTDTYKILPIDSVEGAGAVKISDIAGESGKNALNEGASNYLSSRGFSQKGTMYNSSEENFAVSRRNGHWIIKGRIDFHDNSGDSSFADFNIKQIPPSKLVSYDELCLSWNGVKMRIPDTVDLFTSPGGDMAVIITSDSIMAYKIDAGNLSSEPSIKIPLHARETVVMAEWATGGYTAKWEKDFLKNNVTKIKSSIKD